MPPKAAADAKKDDKKKGGKAVTKTAKVKIVVRESPAVIRRRRKTKFRAALTQAVQNYKNVIVCNIDNVGSNQIQLVRMKLREYDSVMLVGKNTVIRPVLRDLAAAGHTKIANLLEHVRYNVGFIFTNSNELGEIRDVVCANKIPAAAKPGVIAPIDVHIPAGPTPLDPGQTSFFQALNIATKITRGAIEIINPVHLIKKDERVSASAVALLGKLNIKPFFYGVSVAKVYEDGFVYDGLVLDISKKDIYNAFVRSVETIRLVSLAAKQTNGLTIRNSLIKGHNVLLKACVNLKEYSFPSAESIRTALGLENFPVAGAEEEEAEKSGSGSGSGSD
jgi:large subunit ribosomal protein LP0